MGAAIRSCPGLGRIRYIGPQQWVILERARDTGEYQCVYNLRVADYNTYFVGSGAWNFSVWAHNSYNELAAAVQNPDTGAPEMSRRQTSGILSSALRLGGTAEGAAQRIVQSFEQRGRPLTTALPGTIGVNDQRVANFVEAGLQGHFTPDEVRQASFTVRATAMQAAYTAANPGAAVPGPQQFLTSVFPARSQEHVLNGNVNPAGTHASGLHHLGGTGRLLPGPGAIIQPPNAQGVYEAQVQILNAATGAYVSKTNNGGVSTLFSTISPRVRPPFCSGRGYMIMLTIMYSYIAQTSPRRKGKNTLLFG